MTTGDSKIRISVDKKKKKWYTENNGISPGREKREVNGMFVIELAEKRVRIQNQYPFVERQCRELGYTVPGIDADFEVRVTDEEIAGEQAQSPREHSPGYCESICVYRKICEKMPEYGVFILHSAVVEVDGLAYAFAAKSGVGKSTHLSLWLKAIPGARVLNGDKPLFRLETDGSITVFGTPWQGKENWGYNGKAKLAALCFLERGEVNRICRADEDEVIARVLHQLLLRGSRELVNRQLALLDQLIHAVPYFILQCNISEEAAVLCYQTMRRAIEREETK